MKSRIIAYVCLILLMLTFVASAAYMREVTTNPASIYPKGKFTVEVKLGGNTCGTQMRFSMDDKEFESKNIGCLKDDVKSNEWDLSKNPLDCGTHELKVELLDSGEVIQKETRTLKIGNVPNIILTPEQPNPQKDITITFKNNKTGQGIEDMDVRIYNILDGPSSAKDYTTNNKGEISYMADVAGEFKLTIDDPNYCSSINFWVKKTLPFAGPNPPDPVVGERIGVAVPGGVGVKYVDSKGAVYPLKNAGGGVNFTIDQAGDYTLIAGDFSTRYWSVIKKFSVSEKARMEVRITPDRIVVDKVLLLTATSRGVAVENAMVEITKPIGGYEKLKTNDKGEIRFNPESAGEYHYRIDKDRYLPSEDDFEAYNAIEVVTEPDEPISDQDVTLKVMNQMGDRVDNALISLEDQSGVLVSGGTDIDGSFKFRLQEPKDYILKIQKEGYWDFESKLRIYGIISLNLNSNEIEIEDSIVISVLDKQGAEISADLAVTKPDGRTEGIADRVYTPGSVGDYEIKATKEGYRSAASKLKVNPHPLDLNKTIEGDKLIIRASSHNEPVPGITVNIKTPTEEKQVVTDANGIITAVIGKEGNITISANVIKANENYKSKTLKERIVKRYNYLLLIPPLIFIIATAIAVVFVIDYLHKRRGETKKKRLSGKGGKRGLLERSSSSSLSKP